MKNLVIATALAGLFTFTHVNASSAGEHVSCYNAAYSWPTDRSNTVGIVDGQVVYDVHPDGVVATKSGGKVKSMKETSQTNRLDFSVRGHTYEVFGHEMIESQRFAFPSKDTLAAKLLFLKQTRLPADRVDVSLLEDPALCKHLTPLEMRTN